MINKSKILLMAVLLLLALAQVASAALGQVGPVLPDTDPGPGWSLGYNGFPVWYRDKLGQTVMLSNPPSPLSIPDPVIPGNAFSAQIGFGSEAMYWHSTALMTGANGDSLLVLALEAAFAGGDAADKDQITFQRIRVRIDAPVAGTYTVTHPYGVKVYDVAAADVGRRAINDTIDVGVGSPGVFTGALSGAIGPLLKQVGAPPGTMGDAATPAPVVNGPNGNIFRVQGPGGLDVSTNLFVTGGQLFTGTPFNIARTILTRNAGGAWVDSFVTIPLPLTPGDIVAMTVAVGAQAPAALTQNGELFFGRTPITGAVPTQVTVNATTNGLQPTSQDFPLVDIVVVKAANYSLSKKTLTISAVSTDTLATLRAFNFIGATAAGQVVNPNGVVFAGVPSPPVSILVKSSSGGSSTFRTLLVQ